MDRNALADLMDALVNAEDHMVHARRIAAAISYQHYDAITIQAKEVADLCDLIARDANKETGK